MPPLPRTKNNFEHNPYQPKPRELVELAPALGLEQSTEVVTVRESLDALLARAQKIELPEEARRSLDLVNKSYKRAAPGFFAFDGHVLPEGGKSFVQVQQAVADLLRAVEIASKQVAAQEPNTGGSRYELAAFRLPPQPYRDNNSGYEDIAHISQPISEVLARAQYGAVPPQPQAVTKLQMALAYLQEHGIIPTHSSVPAQPTEEATAALARHGMVWIRNNRGTRSWDPRLDTSRNQSLFTAAPQYLERLHTHQSSAKQQLIQDCLSARRSESEEATGRSQIVRLRAACAEEMTGTPLSEPTLLRWEALYRFLKATVARSY